MPNSPCCESPSQGSQHLNRMTRSLSIHLVLAEHCHAGTGWGTPPSELQSKEGASLYILCLYAGSISACLTVKHLGCSQRDGDLGVCSSHATEAAETVTLSALTVTVPASWGLGLWQEGPRHWVSSAGAGQLPSELCSPRESPWLLDPGSPMKAGCGPGTLQACFLISWLSPCYANPPL